MAESISGTRRLETSKLTRHQYLILVVAIVGDMFEYFDYFLIGFVLAFLVTPWHLTFGQSALVLFSSGVGAIIGAYFWGALADAYGRRPIFIATLATAAVGTGIMVLTPDKGWPFLVVFRFVVGLGVGGLYVVDLPLVQEFVPTHRRGLLGGIVTAFIPLGVLLGSLLAAGLSPIIGWRGLFLVGLAPVLVCLAVRTWVPESPRWLIKNGRTEDAKRSLAWALETSPDKVEIPSEWRTSQEFRWTRLFRYPRQLALSWLTNLFGQTAGYGVELWAPTLFVIIAHVPPATAALMYTAVSVSAIVGRFVFAFLSEHLGRKAGGVLLGAGTFVALLMAALFHSVFLAGVSVFWLSLIASQFFQNGGFAIIGPYAAEVWPLSLRTSGMGSAYGFGGLGKILGPVSLALIAGTGNFVTPKATLDAVTPAFLYLACMGFLLMLTFLLLGIEVKGKSIEQIDAELSPSPSEG
ncbi:MAG: MFS transporter [bacterium]|jgi:putative MFS transporter|nr:MFS transporter [bacterium]